jgi:hypothetical protein
VYLTNDLCIIHSYTDRELAAKVRGPTGCFIDRKTPLAINEAREPVSKGSIHPYSLLPAQSPTHLLCGIGRSCPQLTINFTLSLFTLKLPEKLLSLHVASKPYQRLTVTRDQRLSEFFDRLYDKCCL